MTHHYILIDGNNVAFQCQTAAMQKGSRANRLFCGDQETTAISGVLAAARELRRKHPKARLLMLWDTGKCWRYGIHPSYKGNRKSNPALVEAKAAIETQKSFIVELCDAIGIPQVTAENYEADDIAAFMSNMLANAGHRVTLVTRDQDWLQLVRPGVSWYDRFSDREVNALTFEAEVGYATPAKFSESKIFKGDAGDNVPGIKGVGDVGAECLVNTFETPERFIEEWHDWVLDGGLDNKHPLNRNKKPIEAFLADKNAALEHMTLNRRLMDLRIMFGNKQLLTAIRKTPAAINEPLLRSRLSQLAFTKIVNGMSQWLAPFAQPAE